MPKSIIGLFHDDYAHSPVLEIFRLQNYYQVLGVEPTASFEVIKKAYRRKAMQHHPDRGGLHAQMVTVNEAWEVLSNPKVRFQYDEMQKSGSTLDGTAFAEARRRSRSYERDWNKFDSWLSSVSRDFESAEFGSKNVFGMEMPTSSNSISGWIFLITGGLIGFLIWLSLFEAMEQAWAPKKKFVPPSDFPFPGIRRYQKTEFNPMGIRVMLLTCVALIGGGAWSGKWFHQTFGNRIAGWLPKQMPFQFSDLGPLALGMGKESKNKQSTANTATQPTRCPNCRQKLRLPNAAENQTITCPKCQTKFESPEQTNNQPKGTGMKFPPDNSSLASLLRCLLIFEIVFSVISIPIAIVTEAVGEQALVEAGLASQEVSMLPVALSAVAFLILLPLGIASWVGLFQHKNWGRWLYLIGTILGQLLLVFLGCFTWTYSWDLVPALDSIGYLNSGIILSLCFLSPLASDFDQSSNSATP